MKWSRGLSMSRVFFCCYSFFLNSFFPGEGKATRKEEKNRHKREVKRQFNDSSSTNCLCVCVCLCTPTGEELGVKEARRRHTTTKKKSTESLLRPHEQRLCGVSVVTCLSFCFSRLQLFISLSPHTHTIQSKERNNEKKLIKRTREGEKEGSTYKKKV